jgi:Ca2+-binding EF-hand superfamily protein
VLVATCEHSLLGTGFHRCDSNDCGWLDLKQLPYILTLLFGKGVVSKHNTEYFITMMDLDRFGSITYNELLDALKASKLAEDQVKQEGSVELKAILARSALALRKNQELLTKSFKEFDRNRNGFLDLDEIRWMLRRIQKGQDRHERRVVLAYIQANDIKQNSQLTLRGLLQAVGALQTTLVTAPGVLKKCVVPPRTTAPSLSPIPLLPRAWLSRRRR